jgi:tetratricopeptide (TPR) repeat protein
MNRRPRFPAALARPRLLAAAQAPCVVLCAPAGGGKTVLAAQLAERASRVVWLRPAGPATSAARLVDDARAALGADRAPAAVDPVLLAELLVDAVPDELLLVVDDADKVDAADLARLLAETVPLLDGGVVVCVRERPAGLVGRLGTAVRVLDAAALAFTAAETAQLLTHSGESSGEDPDRAAALHAATGGWPAAVAAGVRSGVGGALTEALAAAVGDDHAARVALDLLTLVPGAPEPALGPGAASLLARSPLVTREDGHLRLAEPARQAWRAVARPDAAAMAGLAGALAASDPATAVDLLLDAGRPEQATELLAAAVGRLPVTWVRPRLYRLPAPLRRSLPPALSAVQATVDLTSAVAHAERAVALAATPAAHAAARFALGSALAHLGELERAVVELAAAARGAQDPATAAAATGWLGLARLWSGDLTGAAAVATSSSTMDSWVRAECALARDDLATAEQAAAAAAASGDLGPAIGDVLAARLAVHAAGRVVPGSPAAARAEHAYRSAVDRGGLELFAAAGVHGWFLLAAGRLDEAAAVAAHLDRTVGRQDAASRLAAALLALAAARLRGDQAAARRHADTVTVVRRMGFAVVERVARRFSPGLAGQEGGLSIRLVGPARIEADGREITRDAWRSRKAREALLTLAAACPAGLRRDELVESVWPGREPGRGRTLLRTALAEIRRTLEPGRPAGEASAYVKADRERVGLVARVDLATARERAAAGEHGEVLAVLGADVAAGEPDVLEDVRAEASRLRLRAGHALGRDTARPAPERAAAYEAVLAVEPWRHDLADELVALWWRVGDADRAQAADRRWLS